MEEKCCDLVIISGCYVEGLVLKGKLPNWKSNYLQELYVA